MIKIKQQFFIAFIFTSVTFSISDSICAFADELYFPEGVFNGDDNSGQENKDSPVSRYTKYLREMEEPSLWKASKDDQTVTAYRLLWLPSFHAAMAVRITKIDKRIMLHV